MYAAPPVQTQTRWENPLDRDVILDLHVGARPHAPMPCERNQHGQCIHNHSGKVRYIVPAANNGVPGFAMIPSEFDRGIQDIRDGVIVGGLGTCLHRVGSEDVVLHPALDELEARRKTALDAAFKADEARMKAEQDLKIATHEVNKQKEEVAAKRAQTTKQGP